MDGVADLLLLGFDEAGPQLRGHDLHVDAVNPAPHHEGRDDVGSQIGRGADFRHETIHAQQQRDAGDRHRTGSVAASAMEPTPVTPAAPFEVNSITNSTLNWRQIESWTLKA
jgi:hypothetical protein